MTASERLRSEVRANLIFIGVILVGIPLGLAIFALSGSWPPVDGTVTVGGEPRADALIFESPDESHIALIIDEGTFSIDLDRKRLFSAGGDNDVFVGRLFGGVGGKDITIVGYADYDADLEIVGNRVSFTYYRGISADGGERVTVVLD